MADDKLFPHKTSRGESLGRRGGIAKRHIRIGAIGYSELSKDLAFDLSFARTQAEVVRAAKEVWDRAAAITEDGKFLVERLQGFIERNQLSLDVRQELDDAASRLSEAEQRLFGVEGQVENIETSIEELEDKIVLKVDKEELDALAKRVVDVEAELSVQAGEIQLRATKEELNTLELRVQEAEAQLSVHAEEIAAKVNRSEFDLLSGQVATNTANISATADLISSEIARIEANLNSTNRELWYSSIRQAADLITSEVARIEEALNGSNPELWYSSIKQAWDRIESTVAVLNLDADHPQQFSSIKQTADEISSIVTTLNEKSPTDAGQFSSIRQTANQIASVVATLEKDPHDTTQYSAIRQMADEIDLRVRNDQVISAINISPEEVKIQANRVMIGSPAQGLPQGAHLFHFDNSLQSTRGLRPLSGYVATLRPGEGRFGGAVAVEEGTTNLVPSNRLKFEGWTAYSDAQVTLTQNVEFPEIGRNDATRIRTTGGTSTLKYLLSMGRSIADQAYTGSVYIKNIGSKPVRFRTQLGPSVIVNPGEWTRAIASGIGNGTTNFQLRFEALNVDDDLDFIAWGPQAEHKPFATSFVDGTREAGVLRYPQLLDKKRGTLSVWINPHVVADWNNFFSMNLSTGRFLLFFGANGYSCWDFGPNNSGPRAPAGTIVADQWTMHTLTWDADAGVYRYYVNGKLVGERQYVEPDSLPSALPTVNNYGALIDELLILPYAASDEEIRAWYELQAPFYDTDDRVAADLPGGHVITFDSSGMQMTPAGFHQRGMHLNGRMIGFWDINNVPAIGIGDVREMAAQLGSDMEYGLLLNQGEIRASQSVLEASLTDLSVTRDKLGPGSVDRAKLSPGAVGEQQIQERSIGISRLSEQIHVPLLAKDNMNVLRAEDRSTVARESGSSGTWYNIGPALTFPKTDRSRGLVAEALRVVLNFKTTEDAYGMYIRLQVNNQTVAEWSSSGTFQNNSSYRLVAYVDARSFPSDGQVTVQWQWRHRRWNSRNTGESNLRQVFQNDQLPLRWGTPQYTLEEGMPSGCFGGCQVSCQASCQATCESSCEISCQSTCESSCQSSCERSCQSTCEKTSQGGGGCLREGTPVTIWDPDVQEYREIPVEQLQPGMILPGYDPETDTVIHGELINLEDALFSNRFIRIHTDVGPSIDVTYSQPFDVMADVGEGWRWYKMQARFLKPGMKMVRPFDEPEKRIATITEVEEVREYMVHFWNPKTSHGRYIAAGYADQTKWPY